MKKETKEKNTITIHKILHKIHSALKIFYEICKVFISVPDANAPFRLMKRSLVEKYLKKMPEDFNLPNVMLTTYFTYFHEKITFKVITFKPRQGGVNSINFKKIFKIGWKALGDFRNLKRHIND